MRRIPGLDDIENAAGDWDAAAARDWARASRDNREPATLGNVLHEPGRCWCGDPLHHDWPGKDDRAPHPRVLPEGLRRRPAPWQKTAVPPAAGPGSARRPPAPGEAAVKAALPPGRPQRQQDPPCAVPEMP